MSDHIDLEKRDHVLVLRMNRPEKKNALTPDMYRALDEGLQSGFDDEDIHALVILGVEGAFSAGNDLGDFLKVSSSDGDGPRTVFDFLQTIITAKKPVIAGVDGLAIGIGTTMLMHCDYVVAADTSVFKTPFVNLGLVPEAGSSLIGPQIMGYQRAFAMLAMGEGFSAEEARVAGLVNLVTSSAELEATTLEKAAQIAALPPEAMRLSRDLLRGDRADVLARMQEEAKLFVERLHSDEARAAFMAFMQR